MNTKHNISLLFPRSRCTNRKFSLHRLICILWKVLQKVMNLKKQTKTNSCHFFHQAPGQESLRIHVRTKSLNTSLTPLLCAERGGCTMINDSLLQILFFCNPNAIGVSSLAFPFKETHQHRNTGLWDSGSWPDSRWHRACCESGCESGFWHTQRFQRHWSSPTRRCKLPPSKV